MTWSAPTFNAQSRRNWSRDMPVTMTVEAPAARAATIVAMPMWPGPSMTTTSSCVIGATQVTAQLNGSNTVSSSAGRSSRRRYTIEPGSSSRCSAKPP